MDYILWLPSWYPNQLSLFDGDFIQRHARAVSLYNKVTVIYIKKDEHGIVTKKIHEVKIESPNFTEIIIFYHPYKTPINLLNKLISRVKYNNIYRQTCKNYINENGKPLLLHVHVALNVVLQVLWLQKKYQIPFIISEHWSGYLKEAKQNLDKFNPLFKKLLGKILTSAKAITVVSNVLGEAISNRFNIAGFKVIPNVVDTDIFKPMERPPSGITKFIHVSTLDANKNPDGIIEALLLVKQKGYDFKLTIYGPEKKDLQALVTSENLQHQITFKKEVPQNILAIEMQQSDALILYSNYETFGCVVIEANACGIPALLSNIPVFKEHTVENKTGVFANADDPESLAETIIKFIDHKNSFSPSEISDRTQNRFSYEVVARQFDQLYKKVINNASTV